MRSLIRAAHDIWCAISGRCRVTVADNDPLMATLKQHEQAAKVAARESRQRQHYIEDELYSRLGQGGRRAQFD